MRNRVFFGRHTPNWKAEKGADRAANDDDDAEPTADQLEALVIILGFDPDELEDEAEPEETDDAQDTGND
jgi:hypothetical protein